MNELQQIVSVAFVTTAIGAVAMFLRRIWRELTQIRMAMQDRNDDYISTCQP